MCKLPGHLCILARRRARRRQQKRSPPMAPEFPGEERDLRFFPIQNDAPKHLTRDQISHYNERGYVFPLDVFGDDEIAAHRALLRPTDGHGRGRRPRQLWHQRLAHELRRHLRPRHRRPHPRLRPGPAGRDRHPLGLALFQQAARRRQARQLAPGRHLLGAQPQQDRHRLARAGRYRRRQRRHDPHPGLAPPRRHRVRRQPARRRTTSSGRPWRAPRSTAPRPSRSNCAPARCRCTPTCCCTARSRTCRSGAAAA